jgi:hypothetical protein
MTNDIFPVRFELAPGKVRVGLQGVLVAPPTP